MGELARPPCWLRTTIISPRYTFTRRAHPPPTMIPHPAWQAPYELGLAHLRAGCVNEALRAFDEVSSPLRPLLSNAPHALT